MRKLKQDFFFLMESIRTKQSFQLFVGALPESDFGGLPAVFREMPWGHVGTWSREPGGGATKFAERTKSFLRAAQHVGELGRVDTREAWRKWAVI